MLAPTRRYCGCYVSSSGLPAPNMAAGLQPAVRARFISMVRRHAAVVVPVGGLSEKQKIVTIEALATKGEHPIQQAWAELDVPQCGYCQSGMIMAAAALLKGNPNPSDEEINAGITNICRCGTFNRVRKGIHLAARKMR